MPRLLDVQQVIKHDHRVLAVAWAPCGTMLASGGYDGKVKILDAGTGSVKQVIEHDNWVESVAWAQCGHMLASGGDDRQVKIIDAGTGSVKQVIEHDDYVQAVAWAPCGSMLASAGLRDRKVKIIDAGTGSVKQVIEHDNWVLAVAWAPCGNMLASAGWDRKVKLLRKPCFENSHYKRLIDAAGDVPSDTKAAAAGLGRYLELLCQFEKSFSEQAQDSGMIGALVSRLFRPPARHELRAAGQKEVEGLKSIGPTVAELAEQLLQRQLDPSSNADICRQHSSLLPGHRGRFEAILQSAAIWSAMEKVMFQGKKREVCWLINFALDEDDETLLEACLPFIRCLTKFCGVEREITMKHLAPHTLPPPDTDGVRRCYRGGGMNEEHCGFFQEGRDFRFPGFVASSFDKDVAVGFLRMATDNGFPAVLWILEFEEPCLHAMYLEGKYSLCGGESEMLTAPYTWCTVVKVEWGIMGDPRTTDFRQPHKVTLKVHGDNLLAPSGLPLAPWR
eukprot:TRINITY_DN6924_c0_g1_i3.p1 TRINITY_DN6924_c0_g1~~TRINITY_DN6924_c0_g1_i3.p1  ORF type:complete len:504 (-),score=103.94 TRINITY_DN6924_c0_g1_i3:81-1592(-)